MNLFEPLGGQKIFMAYEVFGVWGATYRGLDVPGKF